MCANRLLFSDENNYLLEDCLQDSHSGSHKISLLMERIIINFVVPFFPTDFSTSIISTYLFILFQFSVSLTSISYLKKFLDSLTSESLGFVSCLWEGLFNLFCTALLYQSLSKYYFPNLIKRFVSL